MLFADNFPSVAEELTALPSTASSEALAATLARN
jgi:hypothetical protein